ncbi:MAG: hypothetical protein ABI356_13625 [Steroidobacteraceae bacterium]
MKDAIADLSHREIAEAAEYFSRQKTKSFLNVMEREFVPQLSVVAKLTLSEMIDLAAYAASLNP